MIIVTGAIIAKPESLRTLTDAARAHVHQSRTEPGCIQHSVHADLDQPERIVFFERWESLAALRIHFATPGTRAFMAAVREHAATTERLEVYEAAAVAP